MIDITQETPEPGSAGCYNCTRDAEYRIQLWLDSWRLCRACLLGLREAITNFEEAAG